MRKSVLFLLVAIVCATTGSAQTKPSFKPVTFEMGAGSVAQSGGGLFLYMEPGYTFANQFTAGIRLQNTFQSMKNISSTVFTFDYKYVFPGSSIRLIAGAGLGSYVPTASGGCGGGLATVATLRTTNHFGAMLRTGIQVEHFHLGIEYNFVPTTYVNDVDVSGKTIATMDYKNAYFGISAGITIGGGRKK